jgi:hypothetical protein
MRGPNVKTNLIAAFLIAATISGPVFAVQIDRIEWNESNIATLRSVDLNGVEEFVNQMSRGDVHKTIGEFTWTDLKRDGQYELVATLDLSGRSFFDYLAVYERQSSGAIRVQWFPEQTAVGKLSSVIRDLNRDGQKELVIPTLFSAGSYGAGSINAIWPAVYRLENGAYVEASRQFASFYDADILPQLDQEIAESSATGRIPQKISQIMKKDKILRVLGREPTAGLDQARAWARSSDPNIARAGIAVLREIDRKAKIGSSEENVPRIVVLRK